MLARKMSNGKMYICNTPNARVGCVNTDRTKINNIFKITNVNNSGAIHLGVVFFPKEMTGQKVRLLIEPYPEEILDGIYCDCGNPADNEDMKCSKCRKWEKIELKRKTRKKK